MWAWNWGTNSKTSFSVLWKRHRQAVKRLQPKKSPSGLASSGDVHQVEFTPQAEADLTHINKPTAQRILKKVRWLADNFASISPELLTASWKGFYKLRVGDYRVVYTVSQVELKTITIHFIRHRHEVYKIK